MKYLFEYDKQYNMYLITMILFTEIGFIIGFIFCYVECVGVKI